MKCSMLQECLCGIILRKENKNDKILLYVFVQIIDYRANRI